MHLKAFFLVLLVFQALAGNDIDLIKLKDLEVLQESQKVQERDPNCPSNCNGHGTCNNNGICVCSAGWMGSDCSFQLTALTGDQTLTNQHVTVRSWLFYTIVTASGNGLIVSVSQTSVGGDSDLYLLQNDIPTRSHFAYRDISGSNNYRIIVENAGNAAWYIGVYGFLDTFFTITVNVTGQCPDLNNCNPPNGQCIGQDICQCNAGFSGSDCSVGLTRLNMGVGFTDYVGYQQWNYYQLSVGTTTDLLVMVNQTSTTGDVDLYIKYNQIPTMWNYDFRDTSLLQNFAVTINEPTSGTWYLGAYGFQATNYSIKAITFIQCPNQCSQHGSCIGTDCSCNSGFSGSFCQNMDSAMANGVKYNGFVGDNAWNYFHFTPTSDSNMVISVNQTGDVGDCDLYVKQGASPSLFNYDYRDIGLFSSYQLVIPNPGTQTWYMGLFGYRACTYSIAVTISGQCPGNPTCSNHGQCVSGSCLCNTGFAGHDCSINTNTLPVLSNGVTRNGAVNATLEWSYFQFNIQGSSFVTIDLKELNSQGYLWVYASRGYVPDNHIFDFTDQSITSQFHGIHIDFDQPESGLWYIGVYANPYAPSSGSVPFSIAAWYSPF